MEAENVSVSVSYTLFGDASIAIDDLVGQAISSAELSQPLPKSLRDHLNLDEPKPIVTVQIRELAEAKK